MRASARPWRVVATGNPSTRRRRGGCPIATRGDQGEGMTTIPPDLAKKIEATIEDE
jgi:hypothetical protein